MLIVAVVALAMDVSCSLVRAGSSPLNANTLPPVPKDHFNDYTGLICKLCVERDDKRLADFERETSNRLIVAVYPKAPADALLDDYTRRVFEAWMKEMKTKHTAVIFVFTDDQKMSVQVSAALKNILTERVLKDIVENDMMPGFEQREAGEAFSEGLTRMMTLLRAAKQ